MHMDVHDYPNTDFLQRMFWGFCDFSVLSIKSDKLDNKEITTSRFHLFLGNLYSCEGITSCFILLHAHTHAHAHTHTHTTVLPKLDLSHNQLADDLSSTASSISLLKPLPDSAFLAGSRLESIMLSIIILWE